MESVSDYQNKWLNSRLTPLLPLLGALVMVAARLLYRRFVFDAPHALEINSLGAPTSPKDAAELARMMLVGSSFMFSIVLLLVACVVVPPIARRATAWLGRGRKWMLLAAVVLALAAGAFAVADTSGPFTVNLKVSESLTHLIDRSDAISALGFDPQSVETFANLLRTSAVFINWLILAMVCCLVGPEIQAAAQSPETSPPIEQAARELLVRTSHLNVLLYVGTALLLAHQFRVGALINWCAEFFAGDVQKTVGQLGQATVAVDGLFFSLLIFAVYGPAMMILTRRAQALARSQAPSITAERQWLGAHGFSVTITDWLPRIGAALAPAITGGLHVGF